MVFISYICCSCPHRDNQSCELLRFAFTKKNFTIFFTIFFHFFYNLLGVEIAFWVEYPPPRLPPPKKKILRVTSSLFRSSHKRGHDCKLSNWNKSQFGALLPVPSCSIDCIGERRASRLETNSVHVHFSRHCQKLRP